MIPLNVGLDAWMIQEGCYDNFCVGDQVDFVLEFFPRWMSHSRPEVREVEHLGNCYYRLRARIVYRDDSLWIIDAGFRAFCFGQINPLIRRGNWIELEVYLGLDTKCGAYRDRIAELMAPYQVMSIRRDTAFRRMMQRQENQAISPGSRLVLVGAGGAEQDHPMPPAAEVEATDAWDDDGGRAHYVLQCDPIPGFG